MDGARKIKRGDNPETAQVNTITATFSDIKRNQTCAVAVSWICHRLARTAEVATAILDVFRFDLPITPSHFDLPLIGLKPYLSIAPWPGLTKIPHSGQFA